MAVACGVAKPPIPPPPPPRPPVRSGPVEPPAQGWIGKLLAIAGVGVTLMGVVLLLIIAPISYVQMRVLGREVEYA